MATITQNNVDFSNVPVGSNQINGWGTKYTNMNNVSRSAVICNPVA